MECIVVRFEVLRNCQPGLYVFSSWDRAHDFLSRCASDLAEERDEEDERASLGWEEYLQGLEECGVIAFDIESATLDSE